MTRELTENEFKNTFGNGMNDITEVEIDNPVYIWNYVEELTLQNLVGKTVFENEFVEKVYRNELKTFDHVLLSTEKYNIFLVVVIDLKKEKIYGHRILNLNEEYGIE